MAVEDYALDDREDYGVRHRTLSRAAPEPTGWCEQGTPVSAPSFVFPWMRPALTPKLD